MLRQSRGQPHGPLWQPKAAKRAPHLQNSPKAGPKTPNGPRTTANLLVLVSLLLLALTLGVGVGAGVVGVSFGVLYSICFLIPPGEQHIHGTVDGIYSTHEDNFPGGGTPH